MLVYSRNVAFVSLLISLFTAMLVYAAIDLIMIGPIRAMTRSMLSFSEAPGRSRPHHPSGRPRRRDRRRRARAVADAGAAAEDALRAEASRRSRPGRVEDQPRHAQHPGFGAADVGPPAPGQGSDRAGLRAEAAARARPRRLLFGRRACLWPHAGAAAVAPPAAAAPAGRGRARPARHRRSGIEFVNAVDAGLRGGRRFRPAVPRAHQSVPQRRAGDGGRHRERRGAAA